MTMRRLLLLPCAVLLLAVPCSAARAAGATGFRPPHTAFAELAVAGGVVAAPTPAGGLDAAIAYADARGGVWATRVRPGGALGGPLPAGEGQRDVRDVQVAITERGELVVVWTATSGTGAAARGVLRYAAAAPGRSFSGARTLAGVGSGSGATPRIAALRGGTVAVVFRDVAPGTGAGVLRYARRAPGSAFGPARSLGHDGVGPAVQASPGGGALLAWAQGPLARRALMVASARRGAPLPGAASSVAGRIRDLTLAAGRDGTTWVAWTRRDAPTTGAARRTRAANRAAVGPVQELGTVPYGVPHVAVGDDGAPFATWSAEGPGAHPDVQLAAAQGRGAGLGAHRVFGAGGFTQTSPIPALVRPAPVVLFTRQRPVGTTEAAGVAAADPASGAADTSDLAPAATIGAPGVARLGDGVLVAWPAAGGGIGVSVRP